MKKLSSNNAIKTVLLITISLAACKPKNNNLPISEEDVAHIIDIAIDLSTSRFNCPEYRIAPNFHAGLSDSIIIKSFETQKELQYDSILTSVFAKQYKWGRKVGIEPWVINNTKKVRISDEFDDLLIVISSPMIDEQNQRVFFYIEAYLPESEFVMNTFGSFYGFQIKGEKIRKGLELAEVSTLSTFPAISP